MILIDLDTTQLLISENQSNHDSVTQHKRFYHISCTEYSQWCWYTATNYEVQIFSLIINDMSPYIVPLGGHFIDKTHYLLFHDKKTFIIMMLLSFIRWFISSFIVFQDKPVITCLLRIIKISKDCDMQAFHLRLQLYKYLDDLCFID